MSKNWVQMTASVLGGAGIGAALMYMFDPDKGAQRRDHLADQAHDALGATGEHLGSAWQAVADKSREWGSAAAGYAGSAAGSARDAASNLASGIADKARDWTGSARKQAGDWGDDAADHARGWFKSARGSYKRGVGNAAEFLGAERHGMGATGMTLTAVSALALGAGLMFLLDPTQGRRRRAMIQDKAASATRQTGDAIGRTAKQVANRATGLAHDVKNKFGGGSSEPTDLANRIKSELGHVVTNASAIQVRDDNGRITLTGSAVASEINNILAVVRAVGGVNSVENQLSLNESAGSGRM